TPIPRAIAVVLTGKTLASAWALRTSEGVLRCELVAVHAVRLKPATSGNRVGAVNHVDAIGHLLEMRWVATRARSTLVIDDEIDIEPTDQRGIRNAMRAVRNAVDHERAVAVGAHIGEPQPTAAHRFWNN